MLVRRWLQRADVFTLLRRELVNALIAARVIRQDGQPRLTIDVDGSVGSQGLRAAWSQRNPHRKVPSYHPRGAAVSAFDVTLAVVDNEYHYQDILQAPLRQSCGRPSTSAGTRARGSSSQTARAEDIGGAMSTPIELHFESRLEGSRPAIWEWITSVQGISAEMWPFFRMTVPDGVRSLADLRFQPGVPLFRSRIFLFGFLPIGYSDLTLLHLEPGKGLVEQSPNESMKVWRHERRLSSDPGKTGLVLQDRLTFEPKWAAPFVAWFIKQVFQHRHAVLRRNFACKTQT